MTSSPLAIGIDFGTTKTVAATCLNGGPRTLLSRTGKRAMPSCLMTTEDRQIFAGWETETIARQHEHKILTINAIKRVLGKKGEDDWGWWRTRPQEIAAHLLGRVKIEVEAGLQRPVTQAVIAIPAHFDLNQRWAVQQAAEIAGFQVLRLLNEASAAALTYSNSENRRLGKILVFDFGGGTLDVSVVEVDVGQVHVLGIAGDGKLGGEDFDQRLMRWVEETVQRAGWPTFSLGKLSQSQVQYLRRLVLQAKETLSQDTQAHLFIPAFLEKEPGVYTDLNLDLSRKAFETLCQPLFDRIEPVLRHALDTAKTSPSELKAVLLIGGTSRIPKVEALVQQVLGQKAFRGLDSETCVAHGAALQAAILRGDIQHMLLLDTLSADYLIGLGEKREHLFKRGQIYPARVQETYTTTEDNQASVNLPVYEHYPGTAQDGNWLGQIQLTGLPPAAKGVPKIEVTFDMDANGLLKVEMRDKGLGNKASIVLTSPYRLNDTQLSGLKSSVQTVLRGIPQTPFNPFRNAPVPLPNQVASTPVAHPRSPAPPGSPAKPTPPPASRASAPRTTASPSQPAPVSQPPSPPPARPPLAPEIVQHLQTRRLEVRRFQHTLQELVKHVSPLLPHAQTQVAQWQNILRVDGHDPEALDRALTILNERLAQALLPWTTQLIRTWTVNEEFVRWLTHIKIRLGRGEEVGLFFTRLEQEHRPWLETYAFLMDLVENPEQHLLAVDAQCVTDVERLTLRLLIRQRSKSPPLQPLPWHEEENLQVTNLHLLLAMRELLESSWGSPQFAAIQTLTRILSPQEMASVVHHLDLAHANVYKDENLLHLIQALPSTILTATYLSLAPERQERWRQTPKVSIGVRKACIQELRHAQGPRREALRLALRALV